MAEERRPYIVGVKKIAPEGRDTFSSYVPDPESMYQDIDGGDEEREIGEPARYRVDLTDEGYEAFSAASNLRYIERDETDRALALEDGVESSALEFHQLYGIGDRGYSGLRSVHAGPKRRNPARPADGDRVWIEPNL
ncbi:MAG TPA: hypothetical protein VGP38_09145 [Rubrobacter sp.]|nr:hypothetical protein [Rubrobacter sp.]